LQAVAGVVDQNIDRNSPIAESFMQAHGRRDIGEVNLLHHDLTAVLLAEGLGQSFQPVETTSDQDQRMTLFGVLSGKLLAETARCARNEDPRLARQIWCCGLLAGQVRRVSLANVARLCVDRVTRMREGHGGFVWVT
jgi:hypothetical protein